MPDESEVKEPELRLAKQLIDQIAVETFEPTKYHDDVKDRILADIERKREGQEIAVTAPEPEPARIIDLMEALKASLGKGKGTGSAAAESASAAPAEAADRKPARRSDEAKAEPKKKAAKR
jgi:DNA end-binding protein Ku